MLGIGEFEELGEGAEERGRSQTADVMPWCPSPTPCVLVQGVLQVQGTHVCTAPRVSCYKDPGVL